MRRRSVVQVGETDLRSDRGRGQSPGAQTGGRAVWQVDGKEIRQGNES